MAVWHHLILLVLLLQHVASAQFVPDFTLKPDDCTVLMVPDAKLSQGIEPWTGGHAKFFGRGWSKAGQEAAWNITVPAAADYAVNVLLQQRSGAPVKFEVQAGTGTVRGSLTGQERGWNRIPLEGLLSLPQGGVKIVFRIVEPQASFEASVQSIELIRPSVRQAQRERALEMRADPRWFQEARYGIMVHWTADTMPLTGPAKPYAQAVNDFDVEGFASQMQTTGAGFVVLTTSHARQFFPGPSRALDAILPGRTAARDLVGDLAGALQKRGLRLMLYYHPGAGSDPAWLKACGAMETDTTRFFASWQSIISEAGERYRDRLAGWWFDDGSVSYYYRSAPWESLHKAARAGFSQRLIGFNPWELASPTDFQDFYCGEGRAEPSGADAMLIKGGDGRYPRGAYAGLQASATLIFEHDWVHTRRDSEIPPPRWTAPQLAALLARFHSYRNVPIWNLEIYQDGKVSPASVDVFQEARKILRASGWK